MSVTRITWGETSKSLKLFAQNIICKDLLCFVRDVGPNLNEGNERENWRELELGLLQTQQEKDYSWKGKQDKTMIGKRRKTIRKREKRIRRRQRRSASVTVVQPQPQPEKVPSEPVEICDDELINRRLPAAPSQTRFSLKREKVADCLRQLGIH